jgi:hypothetical protein
MVHSNCAIDAVSLATNRGAEQEVEALQNVMVIAVKNYLSQWKMTSSGNAEPDKNA